MIYIFPRVWNDCGKNFVRRPNTLGRMRCFVPYDSKFRNIVRVMPGIWVGRRSWFYDNTANFERGRASHAS